jgi:hypothetical protein
MSWLRQVAVCLAIVFSAGVTANFARASTMGSLAPHDAATMPEAQQQQWVSDPRTKCRALDSDADPADTIAWQGACTAGLISGTGTLSFLSGGRTIETITGSFSGGVLQPGHVLAIWADGSKYDGDQSAGQFDGLGAFTSPRGDRLDGQWKTGALNGRVANPRATERRSGPTVIAMKASGKTANPMVKVCRRLAQAEVPAPLQPWHNRRPCVCRQDRTRPMVEALSWAHLQFPRCLLRFVSDLISPPPHQPHLVLKSHRTHEHRRRLPPMRRRDPPRPRKIAGACRCIRHWDGRSSPSMVRLSSSPQWKAD